LKELIFVAESMLFSLITFACIVCNASGFKGWIDPDTKHTHKTRASFKNRMEYELVMSDEFNRDGRSFKDGDDPRWTAISKSDDDQTAQGKKSLQFYNDTHVYTKKGHLNILTTDDDTHWTSYNPYKKKYQKMKRTFASGMLQGWNKFCFTGGILEIEAQLPGHPNIGGLWPAIWLLGNLGRATYEESTNLMWPWSFEKCDRKLQHAQTISGCGVTEHFDMHPMQGRGATEIDILEVMPGEKGVLPIVKGPIERPYGAMTLQVPFPAPLYTFY
jgi:beta-glucan synthesis-associated protein KRE6